MFNRLLLRALLPLGAFLVAAPAHASVTGFTGALAPGQWTTTLLGAPGGGGSAASAVNDGTTLTLTSGDDGCATGPCQVLYGIVVPGPDDVLSFHWSYASTDLDGPAFESFGYFVDDSFTQLSDPAGAATQSGDRSLTIALGSRFGWYVDCSDCISGNAVSTISSVQAVPEPSTFALLGFGVATLAARRRRASAAKKTTVPTARRLSARSHEAMA